jgi:hypothetical protein
VKLELTVGCTGYHERIVSGVLQNHAGIYFKYVTRAFKIIVYSTFIVFVPYHSTFVTSEVDVETLNSIRSNCSASLELVDRR